MRYILIGPPGCGKSTLSKLLGGVDLELYPEERRLDVIEALNVKYFGGAHISRHPVPSDCLKVLLYLPQHVYDERRAARDSRQPRKAAQRHHNMSEWISCADRVVDASGDPAVVARRLRAGEFMTEL